MKSKIFWFSLAFVVICVPTIALATTLTEKDGKDIVARGMILGGGTQDSGIVLPLPSQNYDYNALLSSRSLETNCTGRMEANGNGQVTLSLI